jgi:TRAP-type mannitol/chloroaromatic compound transport system permease small subunit
MTSARESAIIRPLFALCTRDPMDAPTLLTRLDAVTDRIGKAIAWLVPVMMLVQFTIVVLRYVLGTHSVAMQESVMYLHALVFMLAAAWTLHDDGHVRVDILYRRLSERGRAWVDLLGTLFLLFPVVGFITLSSLGYVAGSWAILERSPDGGLPAVFLLKSLILVMMGLLALQGVAQVLRQAMILRSPRPGTGTDGREPAR